MTEYQATSKCAAAGVATLLLSLILLPCQVLIDTGYYEPRMWWSMLLAPVMGVLMFVVLMVRFSLIRGLIKGGETLEDVNDKVKRYTFSAVAVVTFIINGMLHLRGVGFLASILFATIIGHVARRAFVSGDDALEEVVDFLDDIWSDQRGRMFMYAFCAIGMCAFSFCTFPSFSAVAYVAELAVLFITVHWVIYALRGESTFHQASALVFLALVVTETFVLMPPLVIQWVSGNWIGTYQIYDWHMGNPGQCFMLLLGWIITALVAAGIYLVEIKLDGWKWKTILNPPPAPQIDAEALARLVVASLDRDAQR